MRSRRSTLAALAVLLPLGLAACGSDEPAVIAQEAPYTPAPYPSVRPESRAQVLKVLGAASPGLLKVLDRDDAVPRSIEACWASRGGRISDATAVGRAFHGKGLPPLSDKQARALMTGLRKHLCDELPERTDRTGIPPVR